MLIEKSSFVAVIHFFVPTDMFLLVLIELTDFFALLQIIFLY